MVKWLKSEGVDIPRARGGQFMEKLSPMCTSRRVEEGQKLIPVTSPQTHHIHISDVARPLHTRSMLGNRYFLICTDNGSSAKRVFPLRVATGRTVSARLSELLIQYPSIQSIRMDNGTHFKNTKVIQLLESRRIQQIWSILICLRLVLLKEQSELLKIGL